MILTKLSIGSWLTVEPDENYNTLRCLTTPVVAVTSRDANTTDGMIANSAIRASLVPECPRLTFYCFKSHYSHELIQSSGRFCLHLLNRDQIDVVERLGFETGRNNDKLRELPTDRTEHDLPRIREAAAYFDCRVINAMDAGPSTFILGEAEESGRRSDFDPDHLLDAEYLRNQLSDSLKKQYQENKKAVQQEARENLSVNPGSDREFL
jgi:flavin reductase (DIM6/NTAB) family NADH-FMN oxidoreductase RutF